MSQHPVTTDELRAMGVISTSPELVEWIESRPLPVRNLMVEFPVNTRIILADSTMHVIGWDESDGVIISPVSLKTDYDAAMESREVVHAQCLRDNATKVLLLPESEQQ